MFDFTLRSPMSTIRDLMMWTDLSQKHQDDLIDAYASQSRSYHNLYHIAFLWNSHCELTDPRDNKFHRRLANAIACHDVVYDAKSKVNEHLSAIWWASKAHIHDGEPKRWSESATNHSDKLWVAEAIKASADHFADRPMDTEDDVLLQWFLGLDLIPLAAPWSIFVQNTLMIRAEYSHLSDTEWNSGRKAFLTKARDASIIYRHSKLFDLFGDSAKANLSRALAEIA